MHNGIEKMQGLQKYLGNTLWLFSEKLLRISLGLVAVLLVARYLGPEQYGLLSYATSFAFLFIIVAALGLDDIVVKELVHSELDAGKMLGTAFVLKLLGALLVLVIVTVAIKLSSNDSYTNGLIYIVASITIFQSFDVIDFFFQSKVLSKYAVVAKFASMTVSTLVKITLVLCAAPLIAFAWAMLLEGALLSIGYITIYKHTGESFTNWRFDKSIASILLRNSWPLIISSFAVSIYFGIDQVMIKLMLNDEAVGNYAAAARVSEVWYFIPIVISASLFPAIIGSKSKGNAIYHARLRSLYQLLAWIAIGIAIPISIYAEPIINILFGTEYHEAGAVLRIHTWTGIFVFLWVASGKWLVAEGMQLLALYRAIGGLILNIILNFLLIPKLGITGAAIATLVSQIYTAYLFDFFHPMTRVSFILKTKALFAFRIRYIYPK